jgi:hypothetical protein
LQVGQVFGAGTGCCHQQRQKEYGGRVFHGKQVKSKKVKGKSRN